jgi:hypothetical protein
VEGLAEVARDYRITQQAPPEQKFKLVSQYAGMVALFL